MSALTEPTVTPRFKRPRSLLRAPVFVQLLALVMLSLAATLAINVAIVYLVPPPAPEMFPMSEVAASLKADGTTVRVANERSFTSRDKAEPPVFSRGQPSFREAVLARTLADALGVSTNRVRIVLPVRPGTSYERRLQRTVYDGRLPPRGALPPMQERFVMAPFKAAVEEGDGRWISLDVEESGFVSAWQGRILLCFALTAVLLVPVVYLFGRRLVRPITAFAGAAERLGRDPGAPPVKVHGPAEVEQTAAAFNQMQERIRRYVEDRTAMVGAVAHDMRTPLTRLRFRIETTPEPARSKIIADIDEMDAMISAAMAFVREASNSNERRKLELVSLVQTVATEMAETGLDVTSDGQGPVIIDGDLIGLRRLTNNLLNNAVKFGGQARVRVYTDAAGVAVLEVDDDGPGVPETDRDELFEPFKRGEPSRSRATGGSGLGLAVVRSVARAHGGEATIENRAEGGLRARVLLPI